MLSCYIVIVLLLLPACLHYRSALQCHIFAGCVIFIVKEHWESILWYVYDYDSQSAHHKVGRFKVFQVYIFTTKRNISEGGIAKPIVNALNLPKYSINRPDYSIFKPKPHWNYVSTKHSCNNITTILIQISRLFYFGLFSKTNHQRII